MIRVILERQISENQLDNYHGLIRQAKNKASNIPGFLSGEVFHELGNTHHVYVMSCWDSLDAWELWAESEQRHDLLDQIRPLLESDESVVVLESTHIKH